MVNLINSWAKGIILAIIISTIIEIILPEGNNKKYIKTIIGIYLMFVIVQPLISKISNNNINMNLIMQETTKKMNEYKPEDLTLETNAYIEETYTRKIQEDIKGKVKDKGYNVIYLNLNIQTKEEEFYGELNSIDIQVSKIENIDKEQSGTENAIKKIDNVEINLSNKAIEENINKEITEEELEELKEYLSNEYDTSKEKIYINE